MKPRELIFLFYTLSQLIVCESLENPLIGIEGFIYGDELAWDEVNPPPFSFVNKSTYIVPASITGLSLICNASYPVMWNFHQDLRHMRYTHWKRIVSMTRIVSDFGDPSTYRFQTRLRFLGFSNDITGNYTCQSANGGELTQLSQSVYIFWEGSSPPYLTKAKSDINIYKSNDGSNSYLLPCKTSNPNVDITLSKLENKTWEILEQNDSISYDPTKGFTLKDLPEPVGSYKCFVKEAREKDYVKIEILDIIQDDKFPEFNNTMSQEASFNFDPELNKFVCCSNSGKPPLMMLLSCEHPTICALKKYMLLDVESTATRMKDYPSCVVSRTVRREFLANAGVIRCVGDGVDIVREFFFPIQSIFAKFNYSAKIPPPYFSREEARDEDLISLVMIPSTVSYYSNNTIQFYCSTVPYIFSHGIMWSIQWKNKTKTFFDGESLIKFVKSITLITVTEGVKLSINSTIESLTCHAPLWNSTKWKNKTLTFDLKEPTVPTYVGEFNTNITWSFNQTNATLTCEMTGDPMPTISWMRNNRTFRFRNFTVNENGSSKLTIPRVSLNMAGEIVCTGKNIGGETRRNFRIFVLKPEESNTTLVVILVLCGILSFSFLFILLFLFWKMRYQKEKMRHLARVAFKDVYKKEAEERSSEIPQEPQSSPPILIPNAKNDNDDGQSGYMKF